MSVEIDYHQSPLNRKWYWSTKVRGDIKARSTEPQDDEASCLGQIFTVLHSLPGGDTVLVKRRLPDGACFWIQDSAGRINEPYLRIVILRKRISRWLSGGIQEG